MNMKRLLLAFVCWLFCFPAFADEGFYTRFDTGYAAAEGGFDANYVLRTGFGYRLGKAFRTEFTVSRRRFDMSGMREIDFRRGATKGRISSIAMTLNGYWDVLRFDVFSFYVGGGVGIGRNKTTDVVIGEALLKGRNKYDFVWHAGGGAAFNLPKNLMLDVGYDYVDLGYFETKATLRAGSDAVWNARREDAASHEFRIGLRYNF